MWWKNTEKIIHKTFLGGRLSSVLKKKLSLTRCLKPQKPPSWLMTTSQLCFFCFFTAINLNSPSVCWVSVVIVDRNIAQHDKKNFASHFAGKTISSNLSRELSYDVKWNMNLNLLLGRVLCLLLTYFWCRMQRRRIRDLRHRVFRIVVKIIKNSWVKWLYKHQKNNTFRLFIYSQSYQNIFTSFYHPLVIFSILKWRYKKTNTNFLVFLKFHVESRKSWRDSKAIKLRWPWCDPSWEVMSMSHFFHTFLSAFYLSQLVRILF